MMNFAVVVISRYIGFYGEPGYGSGTSGKGSFVCGGDGDGSGGLEETGSGNSAGRPGESGGWVHVDWTTVYPYTTIVICFSQLWALYCLIHFYYGTKQVLKQYAPGAKFVSIKLIVFFSFWQAQMITVWFSERGRGWLNTTVGIDNGACWLDSQFHLSVGSFAAGAQALLICMEMFVASLVHRSVFSYRAFRKVSEKG